MTTTIPLELIDIEGEGYHLTFHLQVNGQTVRVVLDTGASRTVFDSNCMDMFFDEPDLIEEERLSTGVGSNELKSFSIVLEKVGIGDIQLKNYNVAVLDLQHVSSSYEKIGLGKVHGVFGGDLLLKYKAVIDYQNSSLTLKE